MVLSMPNLSDLCFYTNGAIAQAKKSISHQKSKLILHHYHLIREMIN
jgi:hypothetical protein